MTTAAKPSSFFKVFLPESGSERLQIPNALVALTRLKERAPEEFILRNGRGRDWKVKTTCIDDRVFFDNGWKRFVEENALRCADFLVFTFVGSNTLRFKIYELSSFCEKMDVKEEVQHEEENDSAMAMEIEEEKEEPEEEEEGDHYVMEEDEDEGDGDYEEDDDYDDEEEENTVVDRHRAGKAPAISKRGTAGISGSNECATVAAKFVHPDNPHFVAKHLKTRSNELHIPCNIMKDFSLSLPETITLCCQYIHVSSSEQTTTRKSRWTVTGKVHMWKDGRVCIKEWGRFRGMNKIQGNDTCICELVLGKDMKVEMLQVHVVRQQV